jgi:hypothetical protein
MDHLAVGKYVSQVASLTDCNTEAGINRHNYLFTTLLVVTHA